MNSSDIMDITQENQFLSTEKSPEISPTPSIHSSSLPPSPTAPPPPLPPDPKSQSTTATTNRQILQPVPPSKRVLPDANQVNNLENLDDASSYLPRELADIIAIRQRRERA